MFESIPQSIYQIDATDPMGLTKLFDFPFMKVARIEGNKDKGCLILFCEQEHPFAICPTCKSISSSIHDYKRRTVRHLPCNGQACYIEFLARRFYCDMCRCSFREELEWVDRCHRLTASYRIFLFTQCQQTTIQAVSRKERIGYKTVEYLYYEFAAEATRNRSLGLVKKLGIDEIALTKGHDNFVLVLSDLEKGRIIAVLPDRKKETLEAYFATWTQEQRDAVEDAAMDLWEPYAQAAKKCLPKARIVADRFHVMKNLNDQVTSARREIQRGLPEESKSIFKNCRWLLVRNAEDLSDKDKSKLEAMFTVSPALKQLHTLKEDFRSIFEKEHSLEEAGTQLEAWIKSVEESKLTKLSKFVGTLRNRWKDILNYFHERLTSGKVEGLNNKIKVIKRCAYGFVNFDHFSLRVLVECGGTT